MEPEIPWADFTTGLDPSDYGIGDDGRRWWAVVADCFLGPDMVAASNARSAVAISRRAMFDAEVGNGRSKTETRRWLAVQHYGVAAGPLTSPQSFQIELGWYLSTAITHLPGLALHRMEATGPTTLADARANHVPERIIELTVEQLVDRYRRKDS